LAFIETEKILGIPFSVISQLTIFSYPIHPSIEAGKMHPPPPPHQDGHLNPNPTFQDPDPTLEQGQRKNNFICTVQGIEPSTILSKYVCNQRGL
jgi:hypothetical protein